MFPGYEVRRTGIAMNADGIREEFTYRRARVITEKESADLLIRAVAEVAAQLSELVAEVRDIKADMQRADEQLFGVNKP
jgi:hypothetical protein